MSTENNLWMGDIESWMTESFLMQAFNHYNVNPTGVKLIKDRETNINKNYCFVNFNSIQEANSTLLLLNGKPLPGTSLKFKLNWANYYSSFNKSIYVGNLAPDVDDISLYNLFKKKYNSVHHASVITDKGKSKGFGFVLFRNEEEYDNCLREMNGIEFHGNIIKVNEQKKKDDNDIHNNEFNIGRMSDNSINNIRNIVNDNMNVNNMNNINNLLHSNRNNLYHQILNNNINNINKNSNNSFIDTNNMFINNDLRNNSNNINQNNLKNNNINNLHNMNNIINNNINNLINNNLNGMNNINDIHNFNDLNLANLNLNKNLNQIQNMNNQDYMNINVNNFMSFYPKNLSDSDINNRNLPNLNISMNKNKNRNNIDPNYHLDILNKYDDITLRKKIRENLDKTYQYYSSVYPGDKNKLKCK